MNDSMYFRIAFCYEDSVSFCFGRQVPLVPEKNEWRTQNKLFAFLLFCAQCSNEKFQIRHFMTDSSLHLDADEEHRNNFFLRSDVKLQFE